jgi:hypothetical protein
MDALERLAAKDEIRDLALLYCRGVDRKDIALLRTLYTADGTDDHSPYFSGTAKAYVDWLEQSLPHMHAGAHHVCNHLIEVDESGETAEGEVYAIAWHLVPDRSEGAAPDALAHDVQAVRYIDRYAREGGRWKFAARVLSFDMKLLLPDAHAGAKPDPLGDASYAALGLPLFARR